MAHQRKTNLWKWKIFYLFRAKISQMRLLQLQSSPDGANELMENFHRISSNNIKGSPFTNEKWLET